MNTLPENQRPESDDPDCWEVWSNKSRREVEWKAITDDCQQVASKPESNESEESKTMSNETTKTTDNPGCNFFRASATDFKKIPGSPIAYWANDNVFFAFERSKPISSLTSLHRGTQLGTLSILLGCGMRFQGIIFG